MIDRVPLTALSQFLAPLVEDSIYSFDTTQDGSLTPRDFNENDNWPEFVARFFGTERGIRLQFVQTMSRNLKIELCWSLFQLWDDPDSDKATMRKISDILIRDFQVEVKKLKDHESVKQQILRRKISASVDISGETSSDLVQGTGYSSFYLNPYGSISNPFEVGSLRFTPQLGVSTMGIASDRTFRDAPRETYKTASGRLSPSIGLSDGVNERWFVGGGGSLRYRPNAPKGLSKSGQDWNAYLDLDSPFAWPITAGIYANASNSFYAPPLLLGQNQTEEHSNSAGGYFTWNLSSRLALLGSVDRSSTDNSYDYSKYRDTTTSGSLFLKRRTLANYIRLGVSAFSEKTDKEKKIGGETRTGHSLESTLSLGGEYFRFIDNESSISAKLFLSGTASEQQPNATYPSISTTVSAATFLIPKKLFGRIWGNYWRNFIDHHEGETYYESNTGYSFSPMLRWNFTDDIMLAGSFSASQTIDRSALQTRSTSLSSSLNLSMNFNVLRGLEIGGYVYASKSRDEDLKNKDPGTYDSSALGGGTTVTVNF